MLPPRFRENICRMVFLSTSNCPQQIIHIHVDMLVWKEMNVDKCNCKQEMKKKNVCHSFSKPVND